MLGPVAQQLTVSMLLLSTVGVCWSNGIVEESPNRCVIDQGVPFSESHTINALDHFYSNSFKEQGTRKAHVPFYITSNPFIAQKYAHILVSHCEDLLAAGDLYPNETLTILEAGGGSGQFTWHFINALVERWEVIEDVFPFQNLRYIFNDLDNRMRDFVRNSPQFQPHIASGLLDTVVVPLGEKDFRELVTDNGVRMGGGLNPIILIANYFFDSIRADVFRTGNGVFQEGLVTNHFPCKKVKKKEQTIADIDKYHKDVMKNLKEDLEFTSIDAAQRYSGRDADLNNILEWYQKSFDDLTAFPTTNPLPPFRRYPADPDWSTFMISPPAFRIFRELFAGYPGGVLCISSDSGWQDAAYFREEFEHDDITLANQKGGAQSVCLYAYAGGAERTWQDFPVNFHAFELFFRQHGGFAVHSDEEGMHLKLSIFVKPREGADNGAGCADAAQEGGGEGKEEGGSGGEGQCQRKEGGGGGGGGGGGRRGGRMRRAFKDAMKFSVQNFNTMLDRNKETLRHLGSKSVVAEWKKLGPRAIYKYTHAVLAMVLWDGDIVYNLRKNLWAILRRIHMLHEESVAMWRGLQRTETTAYVKNDDIYYVIGVCYEILQDYEGALRVLDKAAAAFGSDPILSLKRALLFNALKDPEKEAAAYMQAAETLLRSTCKEYDKSTEGMHGELEKWSEVVEGVRTGLLDHEARIGEQATAYLAEIKAAIRACDAESAQNAAQTMAKGTRVKARWKGGKYFPGTVEKTWENGFKQIRFDDGDTQKYVDPDHVKLIDDE